jgi:uncharacterized protein (TIGR02099 family)
LNIAFFTLQGKKVRLPAFVRWLQTSSLWIYRVLTWSVLGFGLALGGTVLGLRYWILPNIESYRTDIEQAASRAANQRVTIGKISASWDGLHPQLVLENVTVFDRAGNPALELSRVGSTLSWLSVAALEPRFLELEIYRPALQVRRDARGVISIAGIELKEDGEGGDFTDWLLRQRRIAVRDAAVSWHDEMRGAPALDLKQVQLLLRNRGDRHQFALQATPPKELAGTLDLRGDVTVATLKALPDWNGKIFVQLDYVDLGAWRAWAPFPIEVRQGTGALRLWVTLSRNWLADAVADVRLANVKTRLAKDLPELELSELAGRVAWKWLALGFEFSTTKLELTTERGIKLHPADFLLRVGAARDKKPARGELYANALELEPLAALADQLPLDADLRKWLVEISPKGSVFDLAVGWNGEWREPAQYVVRGRFQNLALNRYGNLPGFSGASGHIDGSERGGTLYLNSTNAALDMPLVFRNVLGFDTLTAQVGWSRAGADAEFRFNNVSFSNPHLAGTLFGNYRMVPGTRGAIDLTGSLARADARHVNHYIPLVVGKHARDWLDTAFLAGQSNDVSLRLKGNLDDFPFPDKTGGVFQVVAKVTGGVLDYANGWPKVENIAGELAFRGNRMDVNVRQGTILGARLLRVHAEIPDLKAAEELLRIDGEAEGPTSEFLAFIAKSPVLGMIDRFTEGMEAQGNGRLALKLEMPLGALDKSKVAGAYRFINNQITAGPDLPALEQANGRLEFTESAVRVPDAGGVFLGGPVSIAGGTQDDGSVRVNLQGRATVENLARFAGNPWWMQELSGATDWKGTVILRKKLADLAVESNLLGIASRFPAPFAKAGTEAVPLRLERKYTAPAQDQVSLSYGQLVSAQLMRETEGGRPVVRRGTIRFGEGAAEPPGREGIWVVGTLKNLDLDRWLVLRQSGAGRLPMEAAGVDLKIDALTAFDRPFHDIAIKGSAQAGTWQSTLAAREFGGTAAWRPEGRGKITARMKKLVVPPRGAARSEQEVPLKWQDLPALDVVAEQFQYKDKAMGRLELVATPEERNWRIDKLRISNPDSTLSAEGALQSTLPQPRTQVKLLLDVNDIGKLLVRLGYPEGVRRGTAKLEGSLGWTGGLQDFDYPALYGNLTLDASKGQFVKLDPGIAKLLGILSLQSLPRRITLDFRDIFSEGFAFDNINGGVKINRGIATTEDFRMQGPAARVFMTGEVDLARETQKLQVRVNPSLSDSVAIGSALVGGPVAGAAAFLAQKILKDPLEQVFSYQFSVGGTWSEPHVSKIERPSQFEAEKP